MPTPGVGGVPCVSANQWLAADSDNHTQLRAENAEGQLSNGNRGADKKETEMEMSRQQRSVLLIKKMFISYHFFFHMAIL